MFNLLLLSIFIILPIFFCFLNILPLGLFISPAEQDYQITSINSKIDPEPWTKINFIFRNSATNRFNI